MIFSVFVFRGSKYFRRKKLFIFINLSWRYGTSKSQKRTVCIFSKKIRNGYFLRVMFLFDVMYHIDKDIQHEVTKVAFPCEKVFVEGKNKILYIFEKIWLKYSTLKNFVPKKYGKIWRVTKIAFFSVSRNEVRIFAKSDIFFGEISFL